MRTKQLLLALIACGVMAVQMNAQPAAPAAAAPVYTQTINYVKITTGKGGEWRQFTRDTSMKMAQIRADEGEIISWTLLRSVYPSGQEARADYMISTISEGGPRSNRGTMDEMYKKAGIAMTPSEANAKRSTLATLVASEMWRPRIRVGAPAKGHYLFLNWMKVHDADKYTALETTVWSPMAQEWVKQGAMSGWIYATKMLPSGTDTKYTAYTADMFPTMEAAFAQRAYKEVFEKVVPGKKFDDVSAEIAKTRDLARRELWEVVERVTKKP